MLGYGSEINPSLKYLHCFHRTTFPYAEIIVHNIGGKNN